MPNWPAIFAELGVADATPRAVGGGDISAAWRVGNLFIKTGPETSWDMFSAEAEGLAELAEAEAIRVPEVVACNTVTGTAFLATTWLDIGRPSQAT